MFETPNRRRIFLLRHGEAAYVAEDGTVTDDPRNVPLTANGRIQARKQAWTTDYYSSKRMRFHGRSTSLLLCTQN